MAGDLEAGFQTPGPLAGEGLFHRLLDRLPAGAYTCDPNGLITYFNEHAIKLWGRAPRLNDTVDRFCGSFRLFTPGGEPISHDRCWMALAINEETAFNGQEIVIERPDGHRITALAHANPIHDDDGRLIGAVNVLVDISDQKRIEVALGVADQAKNEFLATMSHEIRTPINAILGYVDLLSLEIPGQLNQAQRGHLSRVQAAGTHLLSLVDEVLDLSRLEAGQMALRRDALRAAGTAEAALAVAQPLASARGIVIRRAADLSACDRYTGDEDRVRQMLINLLSNAIKFSEPGDVVELGWEARAGSGVDIAPALEPGRSAWLGFTVRDTGQGIPAAEHARIFEPFVQLEPCTTRTRGGSGLGLAISRRLARQLGGDLVVRSAVGEGSTFTLWLPAAESLDPGASPAIPVDDTAAVPPHVFAAAGHLLLSELDGLLTSFVDRLRAEAVGPGAATVPASHLAKFPAMLVTHIAASILAIDDNPAVPGSDSEILRVCASAHGKNRASFGWSEAQVSREYAILADEVIRRIRRLDHPSAHLRQVVGAVRWRLAQARGYSAQAFSQAP